MPDGGGGNGWAHPITNARASFCGFLMTSKVFVDWEIEAETKSFYAAKVCVEQGAFTQLQRKGSPRYHHRKQDLSSLSLWEKKAQVSPEGSTTGLEKISLTDWKKRRLSSCRSSDNKQRLTGIHR